MRRPQMRGCVDDQQPGGDAEGHDGAAASGNPRRHDLAVVVDNVGRSLGRRAIDHPAENNAEQRAVDEVDGEAILAEPEEVATREEGFCGRREMDAHGHEVKADAGVELGYVGVAWHDPM